MSFERPIARIARRVDCDRAVSILDAAARPIAARLRDISAGGFSIEAAEDLEVGDIISLSDRRSTERGLIVWRRGGAAGGIFLDEAGPVG